MKERDTFHYIVNDIGVLTDYTSIPEFDGLIYESNSENNFIMIS